MSTAAPLPLLIRALSTAAVFALMLTSAGCSERPSQSSEDPPLPVEALDTKPPQLTPDELRRRLGANENAHFQLAGSEIALAQLSNSGVTDLEPLRGLKLRQLDIRGLPIADLTPLAGMPLEVLYAEETKVSDLAPLKGMPLQILWLNHTPVADLSPLAGMRLDELNLWATKVKDFSPLQSMDFGTLWLRETAIDDLSVLAGKSPVSLDLEDAPVDDLTPLAEMISLERLNIAGTQVSDLSPLADLRQKRLIFTPAKIKDGLEAIRGMSSLSELDVEFVEGQPRMSPAEFWAKYDAGEFTR